MLILDLLFKTITYIYIQIVGLFLLLVKLRQFYHLNFIDFFSIILLYM